MPWKYKRVSTRQSWDERNMKNAIQEVINAQMGYKKAAQTFLVPQTTLERRVRKVRDGFNVDSATIKGLGSIKPVFNEAQENELVEHILAMEARLFGLSLNELRHLAYDLAERNNLSHHFNREKEMGGKAWLYGFLGRHPELKIRTPEATSLDRTMGFNKVTVGEFFIQIYTTCITFLQSAYGTDYHSSKKVSKVLGLRGKRQVGGLVSAERGTLVTVEICMSAAGNFMPSMFVFPRVRAKPELLDDTPPGSTAEYNASGWMQKDTFFKWFRRFIDFTKHSNDRPVLLLLDGHATHTKNLELINLAHWMFKPAETTKRQLHVTADNDNDHGLDGPAPLLNEHCNVSVGDTRRTSGTSAKKVQTPPSPKNEPVLLAEPMQNNIPSTSFVVSPREIMRLPQVPKQDEQKRNRRRGKTAILTASPYKNELALQLTPKRTVGESQKVNDAKRKICRQSTAPKRKKKVICRQRQKTPTPPSDLSDSSSSDDDPPCLICGESYLESKSEEGWIKCDSCQKWCHKACAGVELDECEAYIKYASPFYPTTYPILPDQLVFKAQYFNILVETKKYLPLKVKYPILPNSPLGLNFCSANGAVEGVRSPGRGSGEPSEETDIFFSRLRASGE
ncbi:hypothetical protein NQ318_010056 [Aromia moschata]|uniref:HTH CENPB-type domain-containing protein n=1 Tax=Aromia moschata TaxID=1265417 RepID=A0AAV8YGF4_9CUCU|nr:hypothetical protein NQ318_010056 [Aromia moschata]